MIDNKLSKILRYTILTIGAIFLLFPLVWMFLTSFKSYSETMQSPPTIFPNNITFENYEEVLTELPFGSLVSNTFIVIIGVVLGSIILSSFASFALAIMKVKGRRIILLVLLTISMVPGEIFIIPVYEIMTEWRITNTLLALIIPDTLNVLAVFLLHQFFSSIPNSLIESARMDGASWFKIYFRIVMPLSKTALTTTAIITGIASWKQLLWPIIVNRDLDKMTLGPGISWLQGMYFTEYNLIMAADILAIIPILILFFIMQRQFMESLATTGGK